MMNFEEFCNEVVESVDIPGWKPDIITYSKEGEDVTGLHLKKEGCRNEPCINLDAYYEPYKEGCAFEKIIAKIVSCASEATMNAETFTLEYVPKNNIQCQLLQTEKVAGNIVSEEIPGTDLSVIYRSVLKNDGWQCVSFAVTDAVLNMWEISKEELREIARVCRSPYIVSLLDFLKQNGSLDYSPVEYAPDVPLYMVTNHDFNYGASEIFFDDTIEEIKKILGEEFMIIPSSKNEVLVMPIEDIEYAKGMVQEVNNNCCDPKDKLSDNIYLYRHGKFFMA